MSGIPPCYFSDLTDRPTRVVNVDAHLMRSHDRVRRVAEVRCSRQIQFHVGGVALARTKCRLAGRLDLFQPPVRFGTPIGVVCPDYMPIIALTHEPAAAGKSC